MAPPVLLDVEDQIATITLNRPERRNAINQKLLIDLYGILETVTASDDVRVAILTGSGPSFCAGLDLEAIGRENLFDPRGDGSNMLDLIGACHKPIIAAVNGHAVTGGFEHVVQGKNGRFKGPGKRGS